MARGRKNGCPVNIRNWLIYIADKSIEEGMDGYWVRINGLTSLTRTIEGDTEDGSSDVDTWAEPYVNKRSGSLDLEGKKVISEEDGVLDEGQEMLDAYAEYTGCEGDATLKFIDPYGHSWVGDYVVTSAEESADDSENTRSWSLEQVGEAETLPYIHVESIKLQHKVVNEATEEITWEDIAGNALTMVPGATEDIQIRFTPDDASNKRFKIANRRRSVARVENISSEGTFTVNALAAGETTIGVTPVNSAHMAGDITTTLTVTVT